MRLVPRHILLILALAVVLLLALGTPVANADPRAPSGYQPQSAPEKRVALVIGNNDYKDKGVSTLTNAVNDAQAVSRELGKVGFEVMTYTNLDLAGMLDAIDSFVAKLAPGGVGLVFYAGHAVEVDSINYLLPIDISANVSPARIGHAAVKLSYLMNGLEKSRQKLSLYILDACRNNPFPKNEAITREYGDAGGLAPPPIPEGTMVIYSAQKGQRALDRLSAADRNPNGLFTREFLPLITQPGLRIDEALRQVRANVKTQAASVGKQQVPALYNEIDGDFYFIGGPLTVNVQPQQVDPAVIELSFWESIKGSNSAEEYVAYLEQYPRGRFAGVARARVKMLTALPVEAVPPPQIDEPPAHAKGDDTAAHGMVFRDCSDCPEMVVIPAGSFIMGSPADEKGRDNDEGPQHEVSVKSFALGRTEVTVGEFRRFVRATGYKTEAERNVGSKGCYTWELASQDWRAGRYWDDPGFKQNDNQPVACVSWNDAGKYLKWLSNTTGKPYRLPSEAEWEYAVRAGSTTARYWGNNPDDACRYANVADQAALEGQIWEAPMHECNDSYWFTAPVTNYTANDFGLHDMIGNVWEWVEDCYHDNYSKAPNDGSAWTSWMCDVRVLRGGSWRSFDPDFARSAYRFRSDATNRLSVIGFRLARMLQ
ncbi:MAG: SUMF1/EgtB/PvdO family nonheme iron enzyme [Sulfuricellaceae bacterium]